MENKQPKEHLKIKKVIWINGAFCSGKTQTSFELLRRTDNSFVFDPENAGYYLRRNSPDKIHLPDFRNHHEWTEINVSMLKFICTNYDGILIIPMTITDPQHCADFMDMMRNMGVEVHHFIIRASRETLKKRRVSRLDGKNSFAYTQMENCLYAFENLITDGEFIDNDTLTISQTAEKIAEKCKIPLKKRGTSLGRFFYWIKVNLKHMRLL